MNIGLSKEELENLPPSEKHIVLNILQDVKRNADLVDEYLTEASHGESDETMSITCGDFFKVVEYYQGNLCIACFLPSFRNGEFAKYEAEACKNYLKHEVPGILKEMRKQQEAKNNDTDSTTN